jgi:hypothetical protein
MRRFIALLATGLALALPAQAAALTLMQVTAIVKKGFTKQVRAKANLAGLKLVAVTVKCSSIGGGDWTCFATYTIKESGAYAKYGEYISVTPTGWHSQSGGTLLKEW